MSLAPVIAVVGPSGVGKDSVIAALAARVPGVCPVRRVITRADGKGTEDFDRVSDEVFEHMVLDDTFVLHWSAHGLLYGIPQTINAQRQEARAVLVNLSRSVLLQAQAIWGELIVVSLTANTDVLAQRLSARGREGAAERTLRLGRAKIALADGLRHVIEVDNSGALDATVDEILACLQLERG